MFEPGQTINNTYIILEQIGSGGGGLVYKAFHMRMQKNVAIKLIKDGVKNDFYNRSEVDVLKNLKNDHLPQVIDFVEDGNDVYTVMEFIEGSDFKQLISNGKNFTEKQVTKYAFQLCEAVSHLHGHVPPIIHSDIKPANVMLTPSDNICLIDFNISMISDNGMSVSKGGSKNFCAPEQFRRIITAPYEVDVFHEETRFIEDDETEILLDESEGSENISVKTKQISKAYIDIRTDIYGIGATLYYMLTSRVPVDGKADFRGIRCSSSLRKAIKRAMDPDPAKRFRNVSELQSALKKKKSIMKIVLPSVACAAVVLGIGIGLFKPQIIENVNNPSIFNSMGNETKSEKETNTITSVTTQSVSKKEPDHSNTEIPEMISIGKNIYKTNMKGTLDLSNKRLNNYDIEDLKYMKNVSEIILSDNLLTDLSAISELTQLEKLTYHNNRVKSLTFAKKLTKLKVLAAENNGISDISLLSKMTKLNEIWLRDNYISDLSPLQECKNVEFLDISCNPINDCSAVSGMTKIKGLYFYKCGLKSLEPFKNCKKLEYVYIGENQITDLTPLCGNPGLIELSAPNNKLSGNLNAIKGLTILSWIDISGNGYTDLDKLHEVMCYDLFSDDDGFDYYY